MKSDSLNSRSSAEALKVLQCDVTVQLIRHPYTCKHDGSVCRCPFLGKHRHGIGFLSVIWNAFQLSFYRLRAFISRSLEVGTFISLKIEFALWGICIEQDTRMVSAVFHWLVRFHDVFNYVRRFDRFVWVGGASESRCEWVRERSGTLFGDTTWRVEFGTRSTFLTATSRHFRHAGNDTGNYSYSAMSYGCCFRATDMLVCVVLSRLEVICVVRWVSWWAASIVYLSR